MLVGVTPFTFISTQTTTSTSVYINQIEELLLAVYFNTHTVCFKQKDLIFKELHCRHDRIRTCDFPLRGYSNRLSYTSYVNPYCALQINAYQYSHKMYTNPMLNSDNYCNY